MWKNGSKNSKILQIITYIFKKLIKNTNKYTSKKLKLKP